MFTDPLESIKSTFKKEQPYRAVVGLSKDGRPIMNPYYDNGKSYDACDVDVCNGYWAGDDYFYVSTFFHPWVIGCYGPGNYPELSQSCSAKPRQCCPAGKTCKEIVVPDYGTQGPGGPGGPTGVILTAVVTVGLVGAAGYAIYFYVL